MERGGREERLVLAIGAQAVCGLGVGLLVKEESNLACFACFEQRCDSPDKAF